MIIGHKKQWEFLKKSFEYNKIPHAILFCGQERLGKKKLAIEFAKFINCSSKFSNRPCQICRNCQDIEKGIHPDFILVEPDNQITRKNIDNSGYYSGSIKIETIRELILKLSLRCYLSSYKVAIIDNAHLMTNEAQNSFLKLLEEPKGNVIIILVTGYPEFLLPTILSRLQKIRFFPVKREEIEEYIVSKGGSLKDAKYISLISFNKPGLAVEYFLNPKTIEKRKNIIADLEKIVNSDFASRFQYVKDLLEKENFFNTSEILNIWLNYFRFIMLSKLSILQFKTRLVNNNVIKYPLSKIVRIISTIQSIDFLLSITNVNPKLAFEILMMEL